MRQTDEYGSAADPDRREGQARRVMAEPEVAEGGTTGAADRLIDNAPRLPLHRVCAITE
jgi:hypothetical protein